MKQHLRNIFRLGGKELSSLFRDKLMVILILYSFTLGVYISGKASPDSITNAAIAVVDEDHSPLSYRLEDALLPPMFSKVKNIGLPQVDPGMDKGEYTFVLVIPPDFQKDLLAGHDPALQLNVDATRMSQAFTGSSYIRQILNMETERFVAKDHENKPAAQLVLRNRFNPNLTRAWFSSVVQLINNVALLAIILTGAALIKERENGTLEHLLVLPLDPVEIMLAKIWSMAVVVLTAAMLSLTVVVEGVLKMPIVGSLWLFAFGMAVYLFAVTSLGIFLACTAKNLPQLGILLILVLMPMDMLSGGMTPRESMPQIVQHIMLAAPATHFVSFSQAILYRGAGLAVVWKQLLSLLIIGGVLFTISWKRFKKSIT